MNTRSSAVETTSPTGHILHAKFLEAIENGVKRFAEEMLIKKFTEQHVRLSAAEHERLHTCVMAADFSGLQLKRSRSIKIRWTASDDRRLERAQSRVFNRMPTLLREVVDDETRRMILSFKRRWRQQVAIEDSRREGFCRRLYGRWRGPLDGLGRMVTIAREFSAMIGGPLQVSRTNQNQFLIAVMVRLHARGCQVADEILVLLRAGLADGAMARWRTLHEIAVVAMFIHGRGESVAERYLLHENIENFKAMVQYQQHARRLKQKPYSAHDVATITKTRDDLVTRFGKGFGSDYGWAGETPDDRPKFDRLEEVGLAPHWRPYYKLASHNVHANPKGILYKMGLVANDNILLTGPSNYGLTDPGQNTAITLTQLSAALGTIEPTVDSLVLLNVLGELSREVGKDFVDVQRRLRARHSTLSARRKHGQRTADR